MSVFPSVLAPFAGHITAYVVTCQLLESGASLTWVVVRVNADTPRVKIDRIRRTLKRQLSGYATRRMSAACGVVANEGKAALLRVSLYREGRKNVARQ
jgi:hypothetical protein